MLLALVFLLRFSCFELPLAGKGAGKVPTVVPFVGPLDVCSACLSNTIPSSRSSIVYNRYLQGVNTACAVFPFIPLTYRIHGSHASRDQLHGIWLQDRVTLACHVVWLRLG